MEASLSDMEEKQDTIIIIIIMAKGKPGALIFMEVEVKVFQLCSSIQ